MNALWISGENSKKASFKTWSETDSVENLPELSILKLSKRPEKDLSRKTQYKTQPTQTVMNLMSVQKDLTHSSEELSEHVRTLT